MFTFVATLLLPTLIVASVPSHLISNLPGYGTTKTKQYSGFVTTPHPQNATITIHSHYWLIEAAAPLDPATAPTLIWFQGGPGGSSMIGLFTENGPLTLNDYSTQTSEYNKTKIPKVFDNEYSWNKLANVVYIEHPAPTGFSYCSGYDAKDSKDSFQCPPWTDETQADASFFMIQEFFSSNYYPELASNELIFSGESYAGVLVPTLTKRLLAARTKQNQHLAPFNVLGFALGNDCPGNRVYTCTPYSGWLGTQVALDFRFRHGMINETLYATINEVCEWPLSYDGPAAESQCRQLLEDPIRPVISSAGDTYQMGGGYYLYDTCDPDLLALDPATHLPRDVQENEYVEIEIENAKTSEYSNNAGTYACGQEKNGLLYLNLESVREAIHVPTKAQSGRTFSFSTALPGYNFTAHSLIDLYNDTLINQLTIMQYSGEADPCVPYLGTERWIQSLQMEVVDAWKPWKNGPYFAGYKTRYGNDDNHFFDFVTVRNAGHMVPRYKPASSLVMMKNFMQDAIDGNSNRKLEM